MGHRLLPLVVLAWSSLALAASASPGADRTAPTDQPVSDDGFSPLLLGVSINGLNLDASTLFLMKGGVLHVRAEDLAAWRIRPPAGGAVVEDGGRYFPLTALAGVTVAIDQQSQVARFTIPADQFESAAISARRSTALPPTGGGLSAFLNYDLAAQRDRTGIGIGSLIESGVSDDWGLLISSAKTSTLPGDRGTVRLDSYYLRDDLDSMTRLTVGDSISRASDWARPVRFGGVQFGTDFGLAPNFISYPTPSFVGRATLPSTVEAFADGVLRYQGDIDQGAFSLNQIPVVTGGGDLQFVVKDQLGGQRTINTPYYVSTRLLQEGLQDYSLEAGAERTAYSLRSFDYRDPFASGTYRYGLSEHLTLESHAELARRGQTLGGGLACAWPSLGEFAVSAAGSRSDAGLGGLAKISFARIERWASVQASYTRATNRFAQLGVLLPTDRILSQAQASGGVSLGAYGNISVAYGALRYGDGSRIAVESANYTVSLFGSAYLDGYVLSSRNGAPTKFDAPRRDRSTTIGFSLTVPFGTRSSADVQVYSKDHRPAEIAQYRQNPPNDSGVGYSLASSRGGFSQDSAELIWRSDVADVTGDIGRSNGRMAERLSASGGIGYIVGDVFSSRRIEDGFGVVSVPGYKNVMVYQENRPLARTDDDGNAVIPAMRAYDANRISIETNDLPLDARVDRDALQIVPRYRGGAVARFPVSVSGGVSLALVLPNGAVLPPGASIRIGDRPDTAFTGYDGAVFLTGVAGGESLYATWRGSGCTAILPPIPPGEKLPDLGRILCGPIEP